jgi:hypothetical protein
MMERKFWGLTIRRIKGMAFELGIKIGLALSFSLQQGRACWKWLRNLLCRCSPLRLCKTQATSAAAAKGFTTANVAKVFDIFGSVLRLNKLSPRRLFSYDETGLSVVQRKVRNITSIKAKRRVPFVSAEKDSLVTIATGLNATFKYIPPRLVFPRSNMKAELLDNAPPD